MSYIQVKPIELQDLHLSERAINFVEEYAPRLTKPYAIGRLPDNYPNYACMSDSPDRFLIGVRCNVIQSDLETNFCHELFHAYQITTGFPTVVGYENDTRVFCEHLRSTILDLSDNDVLIAHGLTYQNIIRARHKQCKRLCATSFKEIDNQYKKDLLLIDLILDLSDLTAIQGDAILQVLKLNLPDVYEKYHEYHRIIFERNDYHTQEGCLNIFSAVFSDIGLWGTCAIVYQGEKIKTPHMLKRVICSTSSN